MTNKLEIYLKDNIIITDGAMGTYYAQLTGQNSTLSEWGNKYEPVLIEKIHREYIEAGAKLIRTNTFSVNQDTMKISSIEVKEMIEKGYEIAKKAVGRKDIFIAASIGPIPEVTLDGNQKTVEELIQEYKEIIDTFLSVGATIFLFETFSHTEPLDILVKYIKAKNPAIFIWTQFAVTITGYTRKGWNIKKIITEIKKITGIDAYGFNCGVGPTHLHQFIRQLNIEQEFVSALPNAGYPEVIHERTIYTQNPNYFANRMKEIKNLGVKIIGGCCGTTPLHIQNVAEKIQSIDGMNQPKDLKAIKETSIETSIVTNKFKEKLEKGKFVIAVELDPPFGTKVNKIIQGAAELKKAGVDVITVADSPLGRPRMDSILVATKITREVGIETIPHLCCRDKNIIGLKGQILGAYIEGIRNLLIVTGDPIPSAERNEIKSVFNLNSFQLLNLISQMNEEHFIREPYHLGGAFNLNVLKKDQERERMERKMKEGASFFMTQPIFDDEIIEYLKKIQDRKKGKILGGIMPLVSYRNAQFLDNEIPGIQIPENIINRFHDDMTREEAENLGIEIAVEMGKKLRPWVDGFYFITPFQRVSMIRKIIEQL